MKCDLCTRESKFTIRRIKTGQTLRVCGVHDNYIGCENLRSLGYSYKEALAMNREVKNAGNL
jgi:hypothetical protein